MVWGGVEMVEIWGWPAMVFVTVVMLPGWVSWMMIMFTEAEPPWPPAPGWFLASSFEGDVLMMDDRSKRDSFDSWVGKEG